MWNYPKEGFAIYVFFDWKIIDQYKQKAFNHIHWHAIYIKNKNKNHLQSLSKTLGNLKILGSETIKLKFIKFEKLDI